MARQSTSDTILELCTQRLQKNPGPERKTSAKRAELRQLHDEMNVCVTYDVVFLQTLQQKQELASGRDGWRGVIFND